MKCPKCQSSENQTKAGRNESGSQRYRCGRCQIRYTPEPAIRGYPDEIRQQAVRMYLDGMNLRRIGRHLGVNHQSVANWVKAHSDRLPPAPQPAEVDIVEMDELFTFIQEKKTRRTS
jgi:transposase-like protein